MPEALEPAPESLAHGRYTLGTLLGEGGFARVYQARDTLLGVDRAVKLLTSHGRARASIRRRLRAEARAMARIAHPNVLRIYDIGVEGDLDFIVMDLCDGGALSDLIETQGPLPPDQALAYTLQILAALAAAHACGIVHRDIKPNNVLLDRAGTALLADFGIALLTDEDAMRGTKAGVAMGTLAYMAPEQRLDARSVGTTADIYAVATSLYFLITGANPVDLFIEAETSERFHGIPDDLRAVLLKGLAYLPENRYPNARAMARDVAACLETASTTPIFTLDLSTASFPDPSTRLSRGTHERSPPNPVAVKQAITFLESDFTKLTQVPEVEALQGLGLDDPEGDEPFIQVGPRLTPIDALLTPAPALERRGGTATVAIVAFAALVGAPLLGFGYVFAKGWHDFGLSNEQPVAAPAVPPDVPATVAPKPEIPTDVAPLSPEPPAADPEPAPAPPAPLSPTGKWKGTIGGRDIEVKLSGNASKLRGQWTTKFGANAISSEVIGRYNAESRVLKLEDADDAPEAGTYEVTLSPDGNTASGQFVAKHREQTTPIQLRR